MGYRQWVLSVPKRVRWHLRKEPEAASGLLRIFLRSVETAVRRTCPDAPPGSRYGVVAFLHRFGDALNSHVQYHVLMIDGVFSDDGRTELILTPLQLLDRLAYLVSPPRAH